MNGVKIMYNDRVKILDNKTWYEHEGITYEEFLENEIDKLNSIIKSDKETILKITKQRDYARLMINKRGLR